jgi:hypothetical protein
MPDAASASDLFPSGPWTGFFLDRRVPGRHQMELRLTFADGHMSGDGRDRVGEFSIAGEYDAATGKCSFTKQYRRKHAVDYSGYNEGKGIWGTWKLEDATGGFHIWPEGMADPTVSRLSEEADVPAEVDEKPRKRKAKPVGAGD